jgi:hypothetical protein
VRRGRLPHPRRPRRTRRRGHSKSNASQDRVSKPAAYATAGIPLYLLVDRWAPGGPTATLYGEPEGEVYRVLRAVKFGDPIELPEPFDVIIDTGEFPVD